MATKPIELTIATPCQTHWQAMQTTELGRYCDRCQKTVVDFSGLTDQQIADRLIQPMGSTCGRFKQSQLNRPLQITVPAASSPSHFFSLLTVGLLGYQTVQAGTVPIFPEPAITQAQESSVEATDRPVIDSMILTDSSRVITGRVIDIATNTGLVGVNVIIQGTSTGVITDSTGSFTLEVPTKYKDDVITLGVVYIGYQVQEIQVRPDRSNPLLINLYEDTAMLGEVVIVGGYKKPSFWQRLRNRLRASH